MHGKVQRQVTQRYAMRNQPPRSKLEQFAGRLVRPVRALTGSWVVLSRFVKSARRHALRFEQMSDEELRQHTVELRYRLKAVGMVRAVVGETFALVREVSGRELGMKHFDVQLVGGWAMLRGMIAEMETGEGKTLTAALPASTAALAGIPVHVITVNDYLAERDAGIMRPVYEALGLTVGVALAGMTEEQRRAAYRCDITYTTNKQVAFDHLRDRIQLRGHNSQLGLSFLDSGQVGLLLRGLYFAIVDEADSVLIDEAVTPLVISRRGKPIYAQEMLERALDLAQSLEAGVHYRLDQRERRLELASDGQDWLADWAEGESGLWRNRRYREHLVIQALRALYLFERDRQYLVDDGKVKIIDEFTGRLMEDRSWEQGLHQLIEMKEGCTVTGEMETIGRISYQRFFGRYLMLGGMSGTAREVAGEFRDVYGVEVACIPTHKLNRRTVNRPRLSVTEDQKWQWIIERIKTVQNAGRPVLVGTRSVAASEHLSELLQRAVVPHRVLNARQDAAEAEIIAEAGMAQQVTVATNMAGRGTDIKLAAGVAERGGLYVIATERHEARRIDRQLFGRCGRQGDPGTCEEFASLEDELVLIHLPPWTRRLAGLFVKTGLGGVERLAWSMVTRGQHRAERLGARMRVQMQKMDEYLGNVLAFTGRLE